MGRRPLVARQHGGGGDADQPAPRDRDRRAPPQPGAEDLLSRALAIGAAALVGCVLESAPIAPIDGGADAPLADASVDAPIDGTPDVGCSGVDGDVLLYLTMNRPNGAVWPDLLGAHDARTAPGTTGAVAGPDETCGVAYNAASQQRLVVDDDPVFDLAIGSLDFFVQVPPPGELRGVLGRDGSGQALSGHLTVFFESDNSLVFRIQNTVSSFFRCSAPLAEGSWVHVGINFGPPDAELYVDGVLANEAMANTRTCGGAAFTGGIAGNDNPWIFGYSAGVTEEGSDEPAMAFLGTAIDEFRLSSVRRDYAGP